MKSTPNQSRHSHRAWVRSALVGFALCFCVLGTTGCVNKLRAKDRLNEGARQFNKGKFDQAERLFKEAMELDPEFMQARLFYATALRSRVASEEGDSQQKTARAAIDAYKDLLDPKYNGKIKDRDRDQAYAFIADLYKTLDDTNSFREWLQKRAELANQKPVTKSECLYGIGVTYWNEAVKISKKYEVQVPGKLPETKKVDQWDKKDIEALLDNVRNGLKFIDQAIAAYPEYTNAYSYRGLLIAEQIKVEADATKAAALDKDRQASMEKFQELNRRAAAELNQGGS